MEFKEETKTNGKESMRAGSGHRAPVVFGADHCCGGEILRSRPTLTPLYAIGAYIHVSSELNSCTKTNKITLSVRKFQRAATGIIFREPTLIWSCMNLTY